MKAKVHKFKFRQTHKTAQTNLLWNYEETCRFQHFTIAKQRIFKLLVFAPLVPSIFQSTSIQFPWKSFYRGEGKVDGTD